MVIINIKLIRMAKSKEGREMALRPPGLPKYSVMFYPSVRLGMHGIYSILINNYYLKYHVCIVDTLLHEYGTFHSKTFLEKWLKSVVQLGLWEKFSWTGNVEQRRTMWTDLSKEGLRWAFPKEQGKANVKRTLGQVSLMVSGTTEKVCETRDRGSKRDCKSYTKRKGANCVDS